MTRRPGLPPEAGGLDGPDRRGIIDAILRMTGTTRQPSPERTQMSPAAADCGRTVTRFAPSPTGYLHLGHVRSALEGWRAARHRGGRFLLRLEESTGPAAATSMPQQFSRTSPGSASTGTGRCA